MVEIPVDVIQFQDSNPQPRIKRAFSGGEVVEEQNLLRIASFSSSWICEDSISDQAGLEQNGLFLNSFLYRACSTIPWLIVYSF